MKDIAKNIYLGKPIFCEVLQNAIRSQRIYNNILLQHHCVTYLDNIDLLTYTWTFTTQKINTFEQRLFYNKLISTRLINGGLGEQYLGMPGFKFRTEDIIGFKASDELRSYYKEYTLQINDAIKYGILPKEQGVEGIVDLKKRLGFGKEYE